MKNDLLKKEIQQLILKNDYTNEELKEKIKEIFEENNSETIRYLYNISTGNGTLASLVGEFFLEKKDYINAYKYFKLSTRNDNFIGMLHLSGLYEQGLGVEKDIKKVIDILKFLETKIEHSKVYHKLGYFYEMGLGVEKNYEKSIDYYKRALKIGDTLSAYNLGMLFLKKGNKEDSLKYLKRAEKFGYVQALNSLGRFYEEEHNYELAINYYKKAAEHNHGNAFLNLGFIYEKGKGVKRNIEQAKFYYEKAVEQGNYKAREILSYLEGTDDKQLNSLLIDYEKNKSNKNYLFVLGTAYLNTKDYKKSIEYYKRSLGLGYEKAKLQLAKAYFFNKDYEEAMELYHELEDTKNPVIYNSLAKIYTYWEDYDTALYCIQQSLKISSDDRTRILLIEIYIKMREYKKAFEVFGTINIMTSKLKVLEIGVCINLKEHEKAIELINKEIDQKSNDWINKPRLMLNKAFCYLKLNDFKKSKEIYENIMEFSDKMSQPYIEAEKRIVHLNIIELKKEIIIEEDVLVNKEIESIEEKLLIDESIETELLDNKIIEEEIITEKIEDEKSEKLLKEVTDEIIDIKIEKENFKRLELITEGKIEKSKSNNVIFYAIGGGDEIGASSYYLEIDGKKFLIDSGLRITPNQFGENYPRFSNLESSGLIDSYNKLDAIFLTHAHLDHVGSINKLFEEKGNTPIYASAATRDIAFLLLADLISNNFNEFYDDNLSLDRYKQMIIDKALTSISIKKIDEIIIAENNEFEAKFYNAGHILGARMLYISVNGYKVLFTGDCSEQPQYTVPAYELPEGLKVDLLVTENTYGNYNNTKAIDSNLEEIQLCKVINQSIKNHGNILFPVFAVGRAQEITLYLDDLMKKGLINTVPIYIDATARYSTKIYEKHGVNIYSENIKDAEKSLIYTFKDHPCIIVTSSGMLMKGSKSYRYAEKMITEKNDLIIFSGYLAFNSTGSKLIKAFRNKNEKFIINNKKINLNAGVYNIHKGAHVTQNGIKELIEKINAKNIILIHGNNNDFKENNLYIDLHKKYDGSKNIHMGHNGLKIFV